MDTAAKPPRPPDSVHDEGLEFEITDFGEARRVLDDESISQFHVATVVSVEQWKRLRRAKVPSDRALTGEGIDWLMKLPPHLRPQRLGAQFPRIVNALAAVWDDPDGQQTALDRLVDDGRKGRAGFPPEVRDEIVALRDWTIALRGFEEPF